METLIVTGGIGSGKSEVCRIIARIFGCPVYDADARVKGLYDSSPGLLAEIEMRLGGTFRDDEGRFIPQALAERIFSDREALDIVESLVFPALKADFQLWTASYGDLPFVVFESATVLEKPGFESFGDKVILVDAPFDVRLERACARDSSSKDKVIRRMMNQPLMNDYPCGGSCRPVDAVIYNTGSLEELEKHTLEVIGNLVVINNELKFRKPR